MHLGQTRAGDDFTLPNGFLRRHLLALGSSGSGKTVLCKAVVEEAIRYNVPAICIDLQGDIAALALQTAKCPPGAVSPRDVTRAKYAERADVKIWTPGSDIGLPLSFAPDMTVPDGLSEHDLTHALGTVADALGNMMGDTSEATIRGLETILGYAYQHDLVCESLADLRLFLADPPADLDAELGDLLPKRGRDKLLKSLAVRTTGRGALMYAQGLPIDVYELFGQRNPGPAWEGRARLSVIYLAHLSFDKQQEFLAILLSAMYRWALLQPSEAQALFYMDEIAPFCPPVAKPPAKNGLMMLLRQARKYGLGMVLATQSPGDLDYKALGQIGTVGLGRITQHQEIAKVNSYLSDLPGADADALTDALPGREPGQFTILCPDHLEHPTDIRVRWLCTEHRLLSRDEIGEAVSYDDREKFA